MSSVASAFTALMAQSIHQHHSLCMYVLKAYITGGQLHADTSLNPRVTSKSTARKLKSGSGSTVTFLTASLLLKGVRLAAAKLQMEGMRKVFVSAIIVDHHCSDPSSDVIHCSHLLTCTKMCLSGTVAISLQTTEVKEITDSPPPY